MTTLARVRPVRGLDPYNIGVNVSSPPVVASRSGGLQTALQIEHSQCREFDGMATVHMAVRPNPGSAAAAAGANGKLVCHLQWQVGMAVMRADIDATSGFIAQVAGTHGIQATVEQVSAVESTALVPGVDLLVNAGVAWGGAVPAARPVLMTGLRQTSGVIAPSSVQPIPEHAQYMYVISDTTANVVTVKIFGADGATLIYLSDQRADPNTSKIPVIAGAAFYQVNVTKNSVTTAVFELHI